MEETFKRKSGRYKGLIGQCRERSWIACGYTLKVGCRVFACCSLYRAFTALGLREEQPLDFRYQVIQGQTLLGHRSGLDHPWLGHLGEGV